MQDENIHEMDADTWREMNRQMDEAKALRESFEFPASYLRSAVEALREIAQYPVSSPDAYAVQSIADDFLRGRSDA